MRLQKYMAKSGVASRRKSEEIIKSGNVKVNGKIVTEMGIKVDPNKDEVRVNNSVINIETHKVYIMLNKPIGYVSTLDDEQGRKIVTDLIHNVPERIYPVGRLDINTTGLILLTNDGEATFKLTHPSSEIKKTYVAIVEGTPNKKKLEHFRKGLNIGDRRKTAPADIKILKKYDTDSILEITIHEGRNRQVRRMCDAIGHPVKKLKRIKIGNIELGKLREGKWRYLHDDEIDYIKSIK